MITIEQSEHDELRATLRKIVQREVPISKAVSDGASDRGHDREWWRRLATEIGVAGLMVPEEFGGAGATVAEQVVVAEELGRALVCTPMLATIGLAVPTMLASGNVDACRAWLPRICSGEVTAAVVYRSADGGVAAAGGVVTGTRTAESWSLSGEARFVIDGHSADVLLVFGAEGDGGLALYLVGADAAGLDRRRMESLDSTRSLAEVAFDGTPAALVASGGTALRALHQAVDVATVLLAAEQQGAAEALLESTVHYAGTRFQFGRPIASFQAIKHRCADLAVEIDRGRSALLHASWAASESEGSRSLGSAAAVAALVCGRAFDRAAVENVQIHGGIGFTWEHSAHLYFRRAKSDAALLASESYYTDRLLAAVGA